MKILNNLEFDIKPGAKNFSYIVLNGEKTNKKIEGSYLEFCVKSNDKYLVFMTDDIPGEDTLRIHLLDIGLNLIDFAKIGSIYSTGSFRNPVIESQDKIAFNFIGDTKWIVELLAEKETRLPFISSLKGVSRKNMFSQYLRIHGNPQPELS